MSLLDDVSIVVTPNGYKAGELYAVVPEPTEGAEILSQPVDLQTDFTAVNGASIVDANTFTTTGGSVEGLTKAAILTVGTQYKLIIEGTTTSSGFSLGNTTAGGNEYGSGFGTHYFTASSNNTLWLRQSTAGTTDITSFSIKEYTSADMNVTRATAATRVDENGLVNYAEVIGSELVTNGDFATDSDWNNFGTPTTSEQSTEQSHTGTYSWKIIADATLEGIYSPNNFSVTSGLQYTVSLWIYSVSGTSIKSGLNNTNASVFTVRTVTAGQWTNITYEATAHTTGASYISILSENSLNFYVDNVSVKEVTRDNVPRIDYTGGGCPHILSEPERKNEVTYSSDFTQWGNARTTDTANQTISPDGSVNAAYLEQNTGEVHAGSIYASVTLIAADYSFSIFAKKKEKDFIVAYDSNTNRTYFNISNGTLGNNGSGGTSKIEDYGNGWYRCSVSYTESSAASTNIAWYLGDTNGSTIVTDSGGVYIYGCQVEQGSYSTSYIPTSGSTVTRNQDIFTRDGIGSLINSTEGVLFAELSALANDGTFRVISLSDGSSSNRLWLYFTVGSNLIQVFDGTTIIAYTIVVTNMIKVAVVYDSNGTRMWVNGLQVGSNSYVGFSGFDRLNFDDGAGGNNFFGKVRQLQVYNTALTDEQLLQLTGTSGTDFYESYAEMSSALTYTIQ